jgi:hypothetical protein
MHIAKIVFGIGLLFAIISGLEAKSPNTGPVQTDPACKWSKDAHGFYHCSSDSTAVLTGSPNTRECGIGFYTGNLRIKDLNVSVVAKRWGADPFLIYALVTKYDPNHVEIRFPAQNAILDSSGKPRDSSDNYICRVRITIGAP